MNYMKHVFPATKPFPTVLAQLLVALVVSACSESTMPRTEDGFVRDDRDSGVLPQTISELSDEERRALCEWYIGALYEDPTDGCWTSAFSSPTPFICENAFDCEMTDAPTSEEIRVQCDFFVAHYADCEATVPEFEACTLDALGTYRESSDSLSCEDAGTEASPIATDACTPVRPCIPPPTI